jgi:hypothetical protein
MIMDDRRILLKSLTPQKLQTNPQEFLELLDRFKNHDLSDMYKRFRTCRHTNCAGIIATLALLVGTLVNSTSVKDFYGETASVSDDLGCRLFYSLIAAGADVLEKNAFGWTAWDILSKGEDSVYYRSKNDGFKNLVERHTKNSAATLAFAEWRRRALERKARRMEMSAHGEEISV